MQTRPATNASYWQIVAARPPPSGPMPPLASSAGENEREPTEILTPAHVDPGGRDHLGRGLDSGSVDPTVAAENAVQRESLLDYLPGAYRHPHTAKAQLDEMVKCQGWTSTAARIAQDSVWLGEFRGKVGFFARAKAKAEHANAERVAGAVAPSLAPIGTAEIRAAQTYRASVQAATQCRGYTDPEALGAGPGGHSQTGSGHGRDGPGGAMAWHDDGQSDRRRAAAVPCRCAAAVPGHEQHHLWRAVDWDGLVLDILVQARRGANPAKRFLTRLLTGLQHVLRVIVTDR